MAFVPDYVTQDNIDKLARLLVQKWGRNEAYERAVDLFSSSVFCVRLRVALVDAETA
jgi:hypothetical protein